MKVGLPSKKELKNITIKLEASTGSLMLPENPTPLEQFRWDICQKFLAYKRDHNITQNELARIIGVDKAKISKILRYRIEEFSTDRLINLFYKIDQNFTLKVS